VPIRINSGIGMILPPIGIPTFLTASIAQVGSSRVCRAALPYAAAPIGVLLSVALAPVSIRR